MTREEKLDELRRMIFVAFVTCFKRHPEQDEIDERIKILLTKKEEVQK